MLRRNEGRAAAARGLPHTLNVERFIEKHLIITAHLDRGGENMDMTDRWKDRYNFLASLVGLETSSMELGGTRLPLVVSAEPLVTEGDRPGPTVTQQPEGLAGLLYSIISGMDNQPAGQSV